MRVFRMQVARKEGKKGRKKERDGDGKKEKKKKREDEERGRMERGWMDDVQRVRERKVMG